jgi:signal peptidase II
MPSALSDRTPTRWTRWLYPAAGVVVVDQVTKAWVAGALADGDRLAVTPFFNLVLAYNPGAAFSMLAQAGGWQRVLFMTIAVAASAMIIAMLRRHADDGRFCLGLSLILGGALGNLVDRVAIGRVVDFIEVHAAGYYFPAFNAADSAITIGAAILIWDGLRRSSTA